MLITRAQFEAMTTTVKGRQLTIGTKLADNLVITGLARDGKRKLIATLVAPGGYTFEQVIQTQGTYWIFR